MLDYILLAVISFSFGVYARGVFYMKEKYKNNPPDLVKPFIRTAEFKPVMTSGIWTTKRKWDSALDIPDTC
jgi:hypothetical protein